MDYIENENLAGSENPLEAGNPTESENPGEGENSPEAETPAEDDDPGEDENPTEGDTPGEGDNPSEGDTSGEDENPTEGDSPGENDNPSGDENPGEDADPMQAILDGLRESLGEKDQDVDSLVESVRSLVDVMSMEQYQPRDIYTPPDIPVEGYKAFDYPITVDYLIKIVGYDEMMPQSAEYDDPDQFLEDFQDLALNCYRGTVFTDFYIDKIYDSGGSKVYDSQPEPKEPPVEEPVEDLSPAILEALQSIDSRLEIMGADLSTVSENSIAYHNDMLIMQEQNNTLQFHLLVTSIGLGFTVFLLLGYIIAHGFWQRMRVG